MLIMPCIIQTFTRRVLQFGKVVGGEIAQPFVLAPVPQIFHRIQFRRIRRKIMQVQASKIRLQFSNQRSAMHVSPIMDQDHLTAYGPQQLAKEETVQLRIDVRVGKCLVEQADMSGDRREHQGRSRRDLVPMAGAMKQQRRLTHRSQRSPNQRQEQESAFVRKNKGSLQVAGLFLMRGHWWRIQASMSCSSRSRGWCWGICGEMPRRASHRLRYRGFILTPKVPSISEATRGAVHQALLNPKSLALRSIHERICSACSLVSLEGAPERERRSRPASPSRRKRLRQRETVRRLTPRKSATNCWLNPSATRSIASNRNCSEDCTVHGNVVMGHSMQDGRKVRHYLSDAQ